MNNRRFAPGNVVLTTLMSMETTAVARSSDVVIWATHKTYGMY
jgi:hypothetical protein